MPLAFDVPKDIDLAMKFLRPSVPERVPLVFSLQSEREGDTERRVTFSIPTLGKLTRPRASETWLAPLPAESTWCDPLCC